MTNYEQPTALIDMDGVLADFDAHVYHLVAERHPDIKPLDPMPEPPNFYVAKHYPQKHYDAVRAISNERGFFAELPVMPDAVAGWQGIMEAGFHPQICSSPIGSNPYSKQEKLGWLEEHFAPVFGSWVVDEAIITRDKYLVPGVVLIDDRPELPNADQAPWKHVIFDRPCNQHIQDERQRLHGWADPKLSTILRESVITDV